MVKYRPAVDSQQFTVCDTARDKRMGKNSLYAYCLLYKRERKVSHWRWQIKIKISPCVAGLETHFFAKNSRYFHYLSLKNLPG